MPGTVTSVLHVLPYLFLTSANQGRIVPFGGGGDGNKE